MTFSTAICLAALAILLGLPAPMSLYTIMYIALV